MTIVKILENIYGWAWQELLRDQGFRKIVEELKAAELEGALRKKAADIAESVTRLEPTADNVHIIGLGRFLRRLIDRGAL